MQGSDLVTAKRVNRWLAVLGPPNMQRCRAAKLDLRPFQVANLRCPKTMPEADQDQRRVPMTIAALARRFRQLLDFLRRQVFPRPELGIGRAD
jgi:hypothetical protein